MKWKVVGIGFMLLLMAPLFFAGEATQKAASTDISKLNSDASTEI